MPWSAVRDGGALGRLHPAASNRKPATTTAQAGQGPPGALVRGADYYRDGR